MSEWRGIVIVIDAVTAARAPEATSCFSGDRLILETPMKDYLLKYGCFMPR